MPLVSPSMSYCIAAVWMSDMGSIELELAVAIVVVVAVRG